MVCLVPASYRGFILALWQAGMWEVSVCLVTSVTLWDSGPLMLVLVYRYTVTHCELILLPVSPSAPGVRAPPAGFYCWPLWPPYLMASCLLCERWHIRTYRLWDVFHIWAILCCYDIALVVSIYLSAAPPTEILYQIGFIALNAVLFWWLWLWWYPLFMSSNAVSLPNVWVALFYYTGSELWHLRLPEGASYHLLLIHFLLEPMVGFIYVVSSQMSQ